MSSIHYYIALLAPEKVNSRVLEWKLDLRNRFGCVAALRSPAHITLFPPFWSAEEMEESIINGMKEVSARFHPFPVRMKGFGVFAPRVVFIQVENSSELEKVKASLSLEIPAKTGLSPEMDTRPFHPHITLATRDLRKNDFRAAWELFLGRDYEESWTAASLTLMRHDGKQWIPRISIPFPEEVGKS